MPATKAICRARVAGVEDLSRDEAALLRPGIRVDEQGRVGRRCDEQFRRVRIFLGAAKILDLGEGVARIALHCRGHGLEQLPGRAASLDRRYPRFCQLQGRLVEELRDAQGRVGTLGVEQAVEPGLVVVFGEHVTELGDDCSLSVQRHVRVAPIAADQLRGFALLARGGKRPGEEERSRFGNRSRGAESLNHDIRRRLFPEERLLEGRADRVLARPVANFGACGGDLRRGGLGTGAGRDQPHDEAAVDGVRHRAGRAHGVGDVVRLQEFECELETQPTVGDGLDERLQRGGNSRIGPRHQRADVVDQIADRIGRVRRCGRRCIAARIGFWNRTGAGARGDGEQGERSQAEQNPPCRSMRSRSRHVRGLSPNADCLRRVLAVPPVRLRLKFDVSGVS